jgi:hypothetical protein
MHERQRRSKVVAGLAVTLAVASALLAQGPVSTRAAGQVALALTFEPHGAFFSRETHQPRAIDPQVFVRVSGAAAGVGPQGIAHVAGLAPAPLSGPPGAPLYNAEDRPLGFTLGRWLQAHGQGAIAAAGERSDRVMASFTNLIPGGVYSLFEVTFGPGGNTFTPLDGSGATNSFTARTAGTARITVLTRALLTHANAVLLVYHSDGHAHGRQRGVPGVTAHHQLIARVP